jgi:modulator of FtsH protease HflK
MSENTTLPADDAAAPPPEGSRFAKAHHVLLIFAGLVILVWLLSGIYQVNADEVAIVERLGQYVTAPNSQKAILIPPGLQYHLPWPIDRVYKVAIQQAKTLDVKTFNEPADAYAEFKKAYLAAGTRPEVINAIFDPYLITGDRNVVHVQIAVTYQIDDPQAWLSAVEFIPTEKSGDGKREEMFQAVVEHTMIAQLATTAVDNVLLQGQDRLPPALKVAIDRAMELPDPSDKSGKKKIDLGIKAQKVDIVAAAPPAAVKPAFDQVFQARSEMQRTTLVAQANYDSARTQAGAQAANMIQDANAYRSQTVNAAKGEAERFNQVFEQYEKAPDVTRWNVYVDAVKSVSTNANRIVYGQPGQHVWLQLDPPQFDINTVTPKP